MDTQINSLIQSPLIRTLQSVPSKSTNFVFGIEDNTPPFGREKFQIDPYEGTSESNVNKFRIPENGYLDRVILKVVLHTVGGNRAFHQANESSDFNAARIIKKITLQANSRVIETLYTDVIIMKEHYKEHAHTLGHLKLTRGLDSDVLGEPGVPHVPFSAASVDHVLYIMIPLSSTQALQTNYQTRFVEELQIWVERYTSAEIKLWFTADAATTVSMNLILYYHSWHDNVENFIRNSNYKRGIPATIPAIDTVRESVVGDIPGTVFTVRLRSNHVIVRVWLFFTNSVVTGGIPVRLTSPLHIANSQPYFKDVVLRGNGHQLWRGNSVETVFDSEPFSLDVPVKKSQMLETLSVSAAHGTFYMINFGLDSNELIQTGALALQSIADPSLTITLGRVTTASAYLACYVEYRKLMRIDSDTGSISVSMDT